MEQLATGLGLIGVVLVLLAYGLVSTGKLKATELRYQLINIVGTAGVLISLMVQWNLSSFILNAAWLVIGIVGIARMGRKGKAV